MKRERFPLRTPYIETYRENDRRVYVCCIKDTSVFCSSAKEVLRFVQWPAKTPTGDALRAWLTELERLDAYRDEPVPADGVSEEVRVTGFGPEAHEDDPPPMVL